MVYGDLMVRLRTQQIRLTVPFSMGKFVVALQDMPERLPDLYDQGTPFTALQLAALSTDYDHSLPQIETCLTLKVAPAQIDLFGAYYTYDVVDKTTEDSEDVTSTLYGLRVIVPIGPLYVKGQYYKMTNPGPYGDLSTSLMAYRNPRWNYDAAGDLHTDDADYSGYGALVGFKVNDMVTVEAGYFYAKTERYLAEEDQIGTYYLVAAVTPIKGVTI
ncbi:MAG: hypothetical protein JRI80_18425 [Deltaproteobacteria bacterium]|nr:hypothetical protein [Deltaproteobacteria bacterium]